MQNEEAGKLAERTVERVYMDCAEQMEALGDELDRAVQAIAANAPARLEASVQQQMTTTVFLSTVCAELRVHAGAGSKPAVPLQRRVGHAARRLRRLNQRYAALLEHAGASLERLRALYRTTEQVEGRARTERLAVGGHHSWHG